MFMKHPFLLPEDENLRIFHLFQVTPEAEIADGATKSQLVAASRRARFGAIDDALRSGLYRHVASLKARNEDDVFYKTRTLGTEPWTEGERVILSNEHARDTEIGDVVVDLQQGDAWMCAAVGWEILCWDRAEQMLRFAIDLGIDKFVPDENELEIA